MTSTTLVVWFKMLFPFQRPFPPLADLKVFHIIAFFETVGIDVAAASFFTSLGILFRHIRRG